MAQLWIASKGSCELRACGRRQTDRAASGGRRSAAVALDLGVLVLLLRLPPRKATASTRRPLAAACARPFRFPRGGERSSQIQSCSRARTFRSFGWVRFWFLEKVGSFLLPVFPASAIGATTQTLGIAPLRAAAAPSLLQSAPPPHSLRRCRAPQNPRRRPPSLPPCTARRPLPSLPPLQSARLP